MIKTENIAVRILAGTGVLALISLGILSGAALGVLYGVFPENQMATVCYILHFLSVCLGCMICIGITKEKKGLYAGLSVTVWYVLLLFISIVLLDCSGSNVAASVGVGACGYGVSLLTCIAPKHKKSKRVKFPSR